jgi:hypothetical protein
VGEFRLKTLELVLVSMMLVLPAKQSGTYNLLPFPEAAIESGKRDAWQSATATGFAVDAGKEMVPVIRLLEVSIPVMKEALGGAALRT